MPTRPIDSKLKQALGLLLGQLQVPSRRLAAMLPNLKPAIREAYLPELLSTVLEEVNNAQTQVIYSGYNMVERMMYDEDGCGQRVAMMHFSFVSAEGKHCQMAVPLITIVPLSFLHIDHVKLDFDMQITSDAITIDEETSESNLSRKTTLFTAKIKGNGSDRVKRQGDVSVSIKAVPSDMPGGLASMLQFISSNCIRIRPKAKL